MPLFDKNGNEFIPTHATPVSSGISATLEDQGLTLADLSERSGLPLALLEDIMALRRRLEWGQAEAIYAAVGGFTPQTLMNVQDNYYRHPKVVAEQERQARKEQRPAQRRSLFGGLFGKAAVLT